MIPGIILAAGASIRMGRPKALLPFGDRTFVTVIVDAFRAAQVEQIFVVIRRGDEQLAAEIARSGATAVVNPSAERGQLSSLIAGLDAVDAAAPAVVVTLVDVPGIRPETIAGLLDRLQASPAPILRATYRGRHGHPVVFRRAVFDGLRRADPSAGAKAVLRTHLVEDVDLDDPAVVGDIDTPEDYGRAFGVRL